MLYSVRIVGDDGDFVFAVVADDENAAVEKARKLAPAVTGKLYPVKAWPDGVFLASPTK